MSHEADNQPIPEPTPQPTPLSAETLAGEELIDPRHTYLAYIFDTPIHYREDITAVIKQAWAHGYPVRYWWLSEAIPMGDEYPDRLIICTHCPSRDEDTGLDLYEALEAADITWNELEAASVEEYQRLGKTIRESTDIFTPESQALFPEISPFLTYAETQGLSSVLLVLSDLRMKEFSSAARENMHLSLQRLSHLFLMLLGNTEKYEKMGQTPEQTFAYVAGIIREMTSYYQLLGDGLLPSDDDQDLPF
ncbi:MAG: hypothetical protein KJ069_26030 [Anaerolineae bacterium]|nr:hypothetical protein [Anaerolineae bacterium]